MPVHTKKWYLRKKNQSQYGPVTMDELVQWAAQCRVVAGNHISRDRASWTPVEEVPELAMEWMAQRNDGKQYGPFPLTAVPELVEHEVLPLDATLTHQASGETRAVQDVLQEQADTLQASTEASGAGARASTAPTPPPARNATPGARDEDESTAAPDAHAPEEVTEPDTAGAPPGSPPATGGELAAQPSAAPEPTQQEDPSQGPDLTPEILKLQAQLEQLTEEIQERRKRQQTEQAGFESERTEWKQAMRELQTTLAATEEDLRNTHEAQHGQRDQALVELRQQSAFMKKNIAALQAELAAAKQGNLHRSRMLAGALVLITVLVTLLVASASRTGCSAAPAGPEAEPGSSLPQPPPESPLPPDAASQPPGNTNQAVAALPSVSLPGVQAEPDGEQALLLRFEQGIFRSLATLSEEGRSLLDEIARQIPRRLAGLQLEIRGHTDNVPLRATSPFGSNTGLAEARAEAVAEHLIRRAGFPAPLIQTMAGTTAPYPNDSPENRARNRTVTIRIRTDQ